MDPDPHHVLLAAEIRECTAMKEMLVASKICSFSAPDPARNRPDFISISIEFEARLPESAIMGGVRGKSQGCGTCRARKIACGQERPRCSQCLKSNRQCTGYQRDKVFVLVQPDAKESARTTRQDVAKIGPNHFDQGPGLEIIMSCNIRQQLLDAFIGRCLHHPRFRTRSWYRPWLFLLPDISTRSKALEFSTLAISSAAIGRKFNDSRLVHQSLRAYTRALREMQKALWGGSLREDETLAACLVLSLYELLECPDNGADAYQNHCQGYLSLVKARGMDAHTDGIGHDLFVGVRLQGILHAIGHRVPNFICEPAWCRDPWVSRPKRMADRIADCLARMPSILQRYDRLSSLHRKEILDSTYGLVQECLRIDQTLQDIYEDLRLQAEGPLYWPVLSPSFKNSVQGQGWFPVIYDFPDLRTATLLMLYWASRAMLWATLSNLHDVIKLQGVHGSTPAFVEVTSEKHDPSPSNDKEISSERNSPPLHDGQIYLRMARNVCQSLEYCLQEDMSLLGILAASIPVIITVWAIRYRHNDEAELAWLMNASQKMRQGLRMWTYI
ncbi:hypothetical protein KXV68_002994 [Aspergillus fumigatus]|nr:hypothetical protein CNMCM8714_008620 [Aspergillus fumigatus]KAH1337086.1 hypothetical protein KXX67_002081 [Aspergillus fumigatus]KAH1446341.1 hypothetical protein KXX13_005357 [Aspergillus fumigatus]KAH1527595.1 hypothetical protein KXX18_001156 [Aspergillus fumigatus]KAH1631618.1 hypothetical protein KXX39_001376 [Aspergillus fumigatus]